jgi:hypothetical protein
LNPNTQADGPGLGEFTSTEDLIDPRTADVTGEGTLPPPFSDDWKEMTTSGAEATALQRPMSRQPHRSGETNGWVALVGFLVIVVGAVAVSIVVWSEMPVWLARRVPDAAPRPALAQPAVGQPAAANPAAANPAAAMPEPLQAPVPPPAPVQADAHARDGEGDGDRAGVSGASRLRPPAPPLVKPAAPASSPADSHPGVGEALDAYRRAFNTLDAASVTAIWPGADVDALARTFSELRYQHLSFDRCQTRVTAADRALVSCDGSISDVLNSGDPTLRRRRASWTIALRRVAVRWTIESISTS